MPRVLIAYHGRNVCEFERARKGNWLRPLPMRTATIVVLLGGLASWTQGCEVHHPSHRIGCAIVDIVDGSVVLDCPVGGTGVVPVANDVPSAEPGHSNPPVTGRRDKDAGGDGASREADGGRKADVDLPPLPRHQRRHVILVIGDGMGYAHQVAASRYLYGNDRGLSFHAFPHQAFVTTWSVTAYDEYAQKRSVSAYSETNRDPLVGYDFALGGHAPYPMLPDLATAKDYFAPAGEVGPHTDSAAAATAMATGIKTYNGFLGMAPDGRVLETSMERLRHLYGMAIGVVTTVPVSHATPAGFLAHVDNRENYNEIAHQMVLARPDVAIGGGFRGTSADVYMARKDAEEIEGSSEYVFVQRGDYSEGAKGLRKAAERAVKEGKKLWGMFGQVDQGMFEPPVAMNSPGEPRFERQSTLDPPLPQAATAALNVLSHRGRGFFLMVEQGAIDKFSHANEFDKMVGCACELDETVRAILEYVDQPDDDVDWTNTTLFVVADHETGFLRFSATPLGVGQLVDENATISWGITDHSNQLITLSAIGAYASRVGAYTKPYADSAILDNTALHALTLEASQRDP